jgi:hypothetical protein
MSVFGASTYGDKPYGGRESKYTPIGTTILVYDNTGALKGSYQQGVGKYMGCEFSHDESGCRDFTLFFSDYVNIDKADLIKIFVFDASDCFFTGVVRGVPIRGATDTDYNYVGYGLNDYLIRLNTGDRTYLNKTIGYILLDLLDGKITIDSPIEYVLSDIQAPDITITEIVFNYTEISSALDQLKKLANSTGDDYLCGVDQNGRFKFVPRSEDVKATLIVGAKGRYGIDEYVPEDTAEAKSKLYILRKDGTYYGALSTTEDVDIYEQKIVAPDLSDADIAIWAQGKLWELEQEQRNASVRWVIRDRSPMMLIGDGFLRIICNRPPTKKIIEKKAWYEGYWGSGIWGGEQYTGYTIDDTLKIKEVKYSISDQGAIREIQIGSIKPDMSTDMIDINKEIEILKVSVGV